MPEQLPPRPLGPLFDAWSALCTDADRRSLPAIGALRSGTKADRERLAVALVALGYPEAMRSPYALGAALRRLRGLRAADGRSLDSCKATSGALWYVVAPATPTP